MRRVDLEPYVLKCGVKFKINMANFPTFSSGSK